MTQLNFPFAEPARIGFAGDWHGNSACAGVVLAAAARSGADVVVQLGDFGLWPGRIGKRYLTEVSRHAVDTGMPVLVVDGNHEDFDRLDALPIDPATGLRRLADQIWHLPRGSRWQWGTVRFGALGGATSLDRPHREPGRSWWPQEAITQEQAAVMVAGGELDVLVAHDCPSGVNIPGIHHRDTSRRSGWPIAELYRAWDHRDLLADVCSSLRPTHLWHGHFHVGYTSATGRFGPITRVRGLSEDRDALSAKLEVVDLDVLAVNVRARRGDNAILLPVVALT
jgi:predicted phosphodiesterase